MFISIISHLFALFPVYLRYSPIFCAPDAPLVRSGLRASASPLLAEPKAWRSFWAVPFPGGDPSPSVYLAPGSVISPRLVQNQSGSSRTPGPSPRSLLKLEWRGKKKQTKKKLKKIFKRGLIADFFKPTDASPLCARGRGDTAALGTRGWPWPGGTDGIYSLTRSKVYPNTPSSETFPPPGKGSGPGRHRGRNNLFIAPGLPRFRCLSLNLDVKSEIILARRWQKSTKVGFYLRVFRGQLWEDV